MYKLKPLAAAIAAAVLLNLCMLLEPTGALGDVKAMQKTSGKSAVMRNENEAKLCPKAMPKTRKNRWIHAAKYYQKPRIRTR